MNADDILNALRKAWPTAAIVPELEIRDEYAYANLDNPDGHDSLIRRIDALMIDKQIRTAIEIKVDRADAKRETWAKIRPWKRVTHRFLYAVPEGLIDTSPVIDSSIGIVWVHADGTLEWRRKCKINHVPEPLPGLVVENIAHRAAAYALERKRHD